MADLLSGGAVGAVMGEVVKYTLQTIKKGREFGPTLETNIETLKALAPIVEEMKDYNDLLDRPRGEIERLEKRIREGEELVKVCKKLTLWNFFSFPSYQGKLQKKDKELQRHLAVNVQIENKRDLIVLSAKVDGILDVLTKMVNSGQFDGNQIGGLCGAPDEPECLGMGEALNKLKIELMKDGVDVLVLTGLGGSGKSTLAKKICWHPQIKGKFGGNIFFVTVSKNPNLKNIVQTLFEHCECRVPEFQTDEEAINRLGLLLRQVGRNPILLVLDDVWPNSEGLVEKFKFRMKDYKILVTSRVAFRRFGTPCQLDPLGHGPAVSLFRHFAQLNHKSSYMPEKKLVREIVRGCKGSPLALQVIAGSLCQQPFEKWQNMKEFLQSQSILELNSTNLLCFLQQSLDILEDINQKECFMDMGLFPEDQRIPVTILIDMWAELYDLDEDGTKAMAIIHDLITRNLINVIATRKVATETDKYYNNHYVMMHDLLRELAIHQSKGEPIEQRKRLIIELNGDNRPDWWIAQNQQGLISRAYSFISGMFVKPIQLKVDARVLSISTDETFSSDWCDMQPDEAEVLVLNLRSDKYSLPDFTEKMNAMPNLVELSIDYCNDLIKLPDGICNITTLKKLSITNCHKLSALPQDLEKLENLEVLRLCSCSDLVDMPKSVGGLNKLRCLDISDCVNLPKLPDDIGDLQRLEKFYMKGCSKLSELPYSVINFENLKHKISVICDDEAAAALWGQFPNIQNVKIEMPEVDINLNFLHGTRSSVVSLR
ncbi:unnamed protein product [Vicia faba]|uniref:RPW8 domain-containing protein n=1 Tax=Vicia faba TaxID=3906 RepID=A0AAV0YSG5_VICFA|nr:unnamed protein product [Vicia faba]